MNAEKLAIAIRQVAERTKDKDTAELVRVLARLVEGKSTQRSFGAPGDWGYGTPIGDALAAPPTPPPGPPSPPQAAYENAKKYIA